MFRRFLLTLALVLPTVVGSTERSTETFTDTVRVVMGSRESQDEVRVYATQEAKRRVIPAQAGIHFLLESGFSSRAHTDASQYPSLFTSSHQNIKPASK